MDELKLIIRTADRTRKAEVTLSSEQYVADIIQAAITNWALPTDTDYTVINASSGKTLNQSLKLQQAGVANGDIIEIQSVLVAGDNG